MKKLIIFCFAILGNWGLLQAQLSNNGALITIQNGATLTIVTDLNNAVGSQFKNDGTVIITGNVTNNEVMTTSNTGAWQLSGTTLQTISGSSPLLVKNLTINNLGGVTLNNQVKLDGVCDFQSGIVNVPNAINPFVFSATGSVGTTVVPADANHVNGFVVKQGTGVFTFPIGNTTKYQPVGTNLTVNTEGVLAKYFQADAGTATFANGSEAALLNAYNTAEHWTIEPNGTGSASGQVTLFWDGQNDASTVAVNKRKVAHKSGGVWLNEGNTATGNLTSGSVTSNAINTWSPFALGFLPVTPLSLTLLDFSVKKMGEANALKWTTTEERDTRNFDVERRDNAQKFVKIGDVLANNGATTKENSYDFLDKNPSEGVNYYRLKMNDLDGKFTYSRTIAVSNAVKNTLTLFPNPAKSSITLMINGEKSTPFSITNSLGQVVKTGVFSTSTDVNVEAFASGLYTVVCDTQVAHFVKN